MRSTIILLFIVLIGCFGCDQKDKLSQGNWLITKGTYKGQKINFVSTDLIQFRDINGNTNVDLKFFEDSKIILPGINCSNIWANWELIDGKLYLSIDTAKYDFVYKMDQEPGSLYSLIKGNPQQKIYSDSLARSDSTNLRNWQIKNPLLTNEFKDAMKVYSAPFEIEISKEHLTLTSSTTSIKTIKDRSLDKLFEGL